MLLLLSISIVYLAEVASSTIFLFVSMKVDKINLTSNFVWDCLRNFRCNPVCTSTSFMYFLFLFAIQPAQQLSKVFNLHPSNFAHIPLLHC